MIENEGVNQTVSERLKMVSTFFIISGQANNIFLSGLFCFFLILYFSIYKVTLIINKKLNMHLIFVLSFSENMHRIKGDIMNHTLQNICSKSHLRFILVAHLPIK